jgi:hypothetical protein
LHARRSEIEHAVLARVYAISDPTEIDDPEYLYGLHAAVAAVIDYVLATIERGEEHAPPIPVALLVQARIAARNTVDVGVALRRCAAGCAVFDDFLLDEAERDDRLSATAVKRLVRSQTVLRDHLLAEVNEEYARSDQPRATSYEAHLLKRIRRLLAGELLDISDLPYNFEVHHLGAVAEGDQAPDAFRSLAKALDCRPLLVCPTGEIVWAWFGFKYAIHQGQLDRFITSRWPAHTPMALGEPSLGLTGWRLTHRQANEAFPIARLRHPSIVRYVDIALPASMSKDDLLSTSLRELYLAPLAYGRDDDGVALRHTLRAYFAAGRNGASAAHALSVSRQTVANHLKVVEERLGRSLSSCALEVEAALRLEDIDELLISSMNRVPKLRI